MRRISSIVVILITCFASVARAGQKCDYCQASVDPLPTVNVQTGVPGFGCDKPKALDAALQSIAQTMCIGNLDPQCEGTCYKQGLSCVKVAAITPGTLQTPYQPVQLQACKGGKGWEVSVYGVLNCNCGCRNTGLVPRIE
jgi:hypothetical protein